jgi:hypothetical protein
VLWKNGRVEKAKGNKLNYAGAILEEENRAMGGGWVLEVGRLKGETTCSKISSRGSEVLYANQ